MALQDTTLVWKILVAIQVLGLILSIIGFAAPNHVTGGGSWSKYYIGLWRSCFDDCIDTDTLIKGLGKSTTWLSASQIMMGMGWGLELVALGLTLLAFLTTLTKMLGFFTAAVAIVSAVFGLIGVAVMQGEGRSLFDDLTYNIDIVGGWAFYLFLFGQLIYVVAGGLHVFDSRGRSR